MGAGSGDSRTPARLADGLGVENYPVCSTGRFAPDDWFPRSASADSAQRDKYGRKFRLRIDQHQHEEEAGDQDLARGHKESVKTGKRRHSVVVVLRTNTAFTEPTVKWLCGNHASVNVVPLTVQSVMNVMPASTWMARIQTR